MTSGSITKKVDVARVHINSSSYDMFNHKKKDMPLQNSDIF